MVSKGLISVKKNKIFSYNIERQTLTVGGKIKVPDSVYGEVTEFELAERNCLLRIYDCGKVKYEYIV